MRSEMFLLKLLLKSLEPLYRHDSTQWRRASAPGPRLREGYAVYI